MRPSAASVVVGIALAAFLCGCARSVTGGETSVAVREGAFERTVDLTGEVRAEMGETLNVPQTPAWQVPLRWLIEDGAAVLAGDRVAEFDNAQVAGDLEQQRAAVSEADAALRQARAAALEKQRQAEFDLAGARDELAAAELKAAVPSEILAAREHADRQLARQRAAAAVGKAEAALARAQAEIHEAVGAAELTMARKRNELETAERYVEALVLRAPRAGLALVQELPWEGRKLQVGDELYPGLPVILVPDLDSLHVVAALVDVDDGEIRGGETARCIADVHPGEALDCRVREVAAVARETSWQSSRRAFRVIVDFLDRAAARRRLLPGMSIRVEVVVERRERARLVPRAAVRFEGESTALRSVSGELGPVRVEACNAEDCVIGGEGAR